MTNLLKNRNKIYTPPAGLPLEEALPEKKFQELYHIASLAFSHPRALYGVMYDRWVRPLFLKASAAYPRNG